MIRCEILTETSKACGHGVELNLPQVNIIHLGSGRQRIRTAYNIRFFMRPRNVWHVLRAVHVIRAVECQSYWLQQFNTEQSNRAAVGRAVHLIRKTKADIQSSQNITRTVTNVTRWQ